MIQSDFINMLRHIRKITNECKEHLEPNYFDTFQKEIDFVCEKNSRCKDIFKNIITSQNDNFVLFRYSRYDNLILKDGENFESFWDTYNGLYRFLRSIVVNVDTMEMVIYPFDKFFNIDENKSVTYDIVNEKIQHASSVEVSNKLDGSMQCARYYNDKIIMSSSMALDPNSSWRLKEGYSFLQKDENLTRLVKSHPNYTFIFEYISLNDQHVVKYSKKEEGLYITGIRDMESLRLLTYHEISELAQKYNVKATETYNMTLDEILSSLDDKKAYEKEGFVLNIDGFFVKIKYNDFVSIHNFFNKFYSPNIIIKAFADGNIDDLISKIPETFRKRAFSLIDFLSDYKNKTEDEIEQMYQKLKHLDKKDFYNQLPNYGCKREIQGFVRRRYENKPFNVLKTKCGYKKIKDLGIKPEDLKTIISFED